MIPRGEPYIPDDLQALVASGMQPPSPLPPSSPSCPRISAIAACGVLEHWSGVKSVTRVEALLVRSTESGLSETNRPRVIDLTPHAADTLKTRSIVQGLPVGKTRKQTRWVGWVEGFGRHSQTTHLQRLRVIIKTRSTRTSQAPLMWKSSPNRKVVRLCPSTFPTKISLSLIPKLSPHAAAATLCG